jgi:hypothetical protein
MLSKCALIRKDYKGAEIILEQHGTGILSPEDKAKQLDEIRNTELKDYNTDYTKLTRKEKQDALHSADVEKNLLGQYSANLALAGNSDVKRQPIIDNIELDKLAGRITPAKADALIGSKVFKQNQDDFYNATVMRQVFKTDDYTKAMDQVYKDMGNKVSMERGNDIIGKLKNLEERKRNDPQYNQLVKDGERMIRDMGADSILAPLDSMAKRDHLTKINMSVQDYHKALMDNPKADPTNLARGILANRFDQRVNYLRGGENLMNFNSVEGAQREQERIVKDALAREQKGLMTEPERAKVKYNLNVIQKEKLRLEKLHPTSGDAPSVQPGTSPTGGAAARGK